MPDPIETIEAYVERIVRGWPALTEAQRRRLEQLLSTTDAEPKRGRTATQ